MASVGLGTLGVGVDVDVALGLSRQTSAHSECVVHESGLSGKCCRSDTRDQAMEMLDPTVLLLGILSHPDSSQKDVVSVHVLHVSHG